MRLRFTVQNETVGKGKIFKNSINVKNYTAHGHDIVHIPAKFRENTAMRLRVSAKTKRDGQTDGRCTDGALQYLHPGLRRRGRL